MHPPKERTPRGPLAVLAVTAFVAAAHAQEPVRLLPDPPLEQQIFGRTVDLDRFLVVGAPGGLPGGPLPGSAQVFDAWSGAPLRSLAPANPFPGGAFGISVATEGDLALVGAWGQDDRGAAYLFDVTTGQQLLELVPNDIQQLDSFGCSVALSGGLAVVGAMRDDDQGFESGSAYVFDLGTGAQLRKLLPNDGSTGNRFGVSVSLFGPIALVGATYGDVPAVNVGCAYLFDVTTGAQLHQLAQDPGAGLQESFGAATALTSDYAVVGSPRSSTGTKRVYVYDTSTGQTVHVLERSEAPSASSFGIALDVDAGRLAVGDTDTSIVRTYELASGVELTSYTAAEGGAGQDFLGVSVALRGDRVVAGASGLDLPRPKVGRAFLWGGTPSPGTPYCDPGPCPCGSAVPGAGCTSAVALGGLLQAYGSDAVSQDDLVLSAAHLTPGQFCVFYMGTNPVALPFGNGLRCAGGSTFRYKPPLPTGPAGVATLGPGVASLSCSRFGPAGCIAPGQTWYFQAWYRDPAGLCGASFNTSNALSVTFSN